MALVLKDRVQETSTTTGTGTITLGGAVPSYQSFATSTPSGSIVYYCIAAQTGTDWEVGYGTFTSPDQLSRTVVLSSSNASALVNFPAGTKNVFVTQPAEKAVYQEANGDVLIPNGIITVIGSNATNPTFSATLGEFVSNEPGFSQLFVQNQSNNSEASSDVVAYNNLGDGTNYFVDVGINSSTYNSATYPIFQANDAYLFNAGNIAGTGAAGDISRLMIGTSTANSNVVIFGGSVNVNAVITTFVASTKDVNFANNISVTSNVSANNVNITNFAYSAGNLSNASNSTVLTTKAYVDSAVATGFVVHPAVRAATPAGQNLGVIYNNGTAGVGATITADTNRNFTSLDDVIGWSVGQRFLVKNQTSSFQNGIYTLTSLGSAGVSPWVATRATDFDTAAAGEIANNAYVFVTAGTVNAGSSWVLAQLAAITVGTTSLPFDLFASSLVYTGTAPINVSGQTISLTGIVPVANGGTNLSSYTTGDVVYASAANVLSSRAIGAANTVLVSNGTIPDWGAVALGSANAVSGTLGPTNGGTGQNTYTLGDIVYANGTNTLAKLAGQTTTTKKFLSQTGDGVNSAAPVWDTLTPVSAYTRTSFTATAGQTTFTVSYTVGLIEVYVNGVLLNGADYTASNGTSVVLAVACNSGDIVETFAFSSFSVASTVSSFSAGTTGLTPNTGTTGNVTLGGTLAVANGGTGVTTSTGSGSVVLGTSPTLTSPTITGAVVSSMNSSVITSGTAVASTSGTVIQFTGIPSWVKRITVMFVGVSVSGSDNPIIQLGTGGTPTYVTTGYAGSASRIATSSAGSTSLTTGFKIKDSNANTSVFSGNFYLNLQSAATNTWTQNSMVGHSNDSTTYYCAGSLALSGTLTALRITTSTGTDTFDAGSINILYE
jgi:hypothetical protein